METLTIGSRIFEIYNDELRIMIYNTKMKLQKWIRFSSEEEMLSYLAAQRSRVARNAEWTKEHKENTRIAKEEMINKLKVWDILLYSCWYSITRNTFFQITQKKWKSVEIKTIRSKVDDESPAWPFSAYVFPIKDGFLEESREYDGWHLICWGWVKLRNWYAIPINDKSSHYESYSD